MHQPIRGGLRYDGLQCVLAVSFVLAQRVDLVDDNAGVPWCGREMRAVLVVVQWFLGLKQLLPVPLFKYSIPSRGGRQGWRSGHVIYCNFMGILLALLTALSSEACHFSEGSRVVLVERARSQTP